MKQPQAAQMRFLFEHENGNAVQVRNMFVALCNEIVGLHSEASKNSDGIRLLRKQIDMLG